MTDALRKSSACDGFFLKKLLKPWPDDHDERPGKGKQHVGDGVGACVAERGNVAARGIADDLHRRGAGAGSHHGAEQHRPVHAQHVVLNRKQITTGTRLTISPAASISRPRRPARY